MLQIVEVASMSGGRTLTGQNYVDLNAGSQVNSGNAVEARYRILCAEGSYRLIIDGITTDNFGPPVLRKVTKWSCEKYGFYHP